MYKKRGKPVVHKPVRHIETGNTYKTYTDAAKAIGGDRCGVRRNAEGMQTHHKGQHFIFVEDEK